VAQLGDGKLGLRGAHDKYIRLTISSEVVDCGGPNPPGESEVLIWTEVEGSSFSGMSVQRLTVAGTCTSFLKLNNCCTI
jgi:hypothetical protein